VVLALGPAYFHVYMYACFLSFTIKIQMDIVL
jgi:hypothetical protein